MIKEVKEDNNLYGGLEISKQPNNEKIIDYDKIKDINDFFDEYLESQYPIIEKAFQDYFEKIEKEWNNVKDDVEKNSQTILFK